ncbi:hypothetical protein [Halolamina salina]|uniref:Uncharacterized protein n=1 Tax=Halolamina salina TaxID=1220023 RepID=A0ABD6BBH7_9EURY
MGGMKQRMMNQLLDSGMTENLTSVLARAEHELLTTAKRMEEAHGTETLGDLPTVEERQAALKRLIEALVTDSVDEVWIEQVAPALLDDPEKAESYLAMDDDEWADQIERWAEFYRENGAEGNDRVLAEHHVKRTFGVDLETFEDRVVNWERGEEAERIFAGNFRAVRRSMEEVTEEAEA